MRLKSYITYRKERKNAHGIHSPFVFDFYNQVVLKSKFVDDLKIKALRKELLDDRSHIEIEDLGAGSKKDSGRFRKISEIAKIAGTHPKYGRLLRRLVEHYSIENIIELGTSLGIGTAYLASPSTVKTVITIEGSGELVKKAEANFEKLGLDNIQVIHGDFEIKLDDALEKISPVDLVFIDGNHTYEATIGYFEKLIALAGEDTFLIFDDIHWSEGMEKAWNEISSSEKINLSMDFFRLGIVSKRPGQAKEHFVIKY